MNFRHLSISWSISRGRDTYGYNICRLDDNQTGKRYRCMGGGYDMIGTVFGNWLEDQYQERLRALVATLPLFDCECFVPGYRQSKELYGLTIRPDNTVSLDGACGIECMRTIAKALGLEVQWQGNRKGHTLGYYVCEKEKN